jgi:thymidylate synthase
VPGLQTQLQRAPRPLPPLAIDPAIRSLEDLRALLDVSTEDLMKRFVLSGYDPHPAIAFKVAV